MPHRSRPSLSHPPSALTALTLFLLLLLSSPAAESETAVSGGELAERLDDLFAPWDRDDSPGVAVLVTRGGRLVFQRGYGLANLEDGVPIKATTRFDLASASKQFTAMAVLLLEQEGMLGLDDDIRLHLPELADLGHPVTIRHLLHHTSGLWDYWQVLQFTGYQRWDYMNTEQMLTLMAHQEELAFEPGSKWTYCNFRTARLGGRELIDRMWTKGRLARGDEIFYAGGDLFASGFGFVEFHRGPNGQIAGFRLSHEFLGKGRLTFERCARLSSHVQR